MNGSEALLVDAGRLEKMILAKRVGRFLSLDQADEERAVVEGVARQLAVDVSSHVRQVLAFELRQCDRLVPDLAEKIAKDVETVSGPFLGATQAFSDKGLIKLIPQLKEYARAVLARRTDLSDLVMNALARIGGEGCVTSLIRNDSIALPTETCGTVVERFSDNLRVMDHFSGRGDLPVNIVEHIADKVSEHCRDVLVSAYDVSVDVAVAVLDQTKVTLLLEQMSELGAEQIHVVVRDMRDNRKLTAALSVEMAQKGCDAFLESSLAVRSGMSLEQVKDTLGLKDRLAFVRLMHKADFGQILAPSVLKLAKERYCQD